MTGFMTANVCLHYFHVCAYNISNTLFSLHTAHHIWNIIHKTENKYQSYKLTYLYHCVTRFAFIKIMIHNDAALCMKIIFNLWREHQNLCRILPTTYALITLLSNPLTVFHPLQAVLEVKTQYRITNSLRMRNAQYRITENKRPNI